MPWSRAGPKRALRAITALLCLSAAAARAGEEPGATCRARRVGDRVFATVELRQLLDAETRRLVQLGMKGRIRVQAAVSRRHWGLFERGVGASASELELAAAGETLLLNGRPRSERDGSITLDRVAVGLVSRVRPEESLTVRLSIEVRVVTASSLSKVAAWATESQQEDASASVVTRALLSAVAEDLTRTAECTCTVAAATR